MSVTFCCSSCDDVADNVDGNLCACDKIYCPTCAADQEEIGTFEYNEDVGCEVLTECEHCTTDPSKVKLNMDHLFDYIQTLIDDDRDAAERKIRAALKAKLKK